MTLLRNAIIGAFAMGAASMVACTTNSLDAQRPTSTGPTGTAGATGSLGFELQLGSGISVNSVSYTISNPTLPGFSTISSVFDTSASSTISLSIALPVGSGYTLTLSAVDSAGDPCLAGPAAFTVVAGQSNAVALTLICQQTIDGGNIGPDVNVGQVTVTADASLQTTTFGGTCAAATVLSAAPATQAVGNLISLIGSGIDPNFQSGDVSLTWSATGGAGTLASTSGASNSFSCDAPGLETITLTASIASTGASCAGIGSLAVQVTCAGAALDAGVGEVDSGAEDAGPGLDASVADTSAPVPDASFDGGVDAAQEAASSGPPTPCTTAPCAASGANSVQCPGSATNDGVCTATEAAIVAHDIAQGNLDATGQLKAYVSAANNGSCYTCLNTKSCLDDNQMDVGSECADTPDLSGGAAGSGVTLCLATLGCILNDDCQGAGGIAGTTATAAQENVNLCYCGGNNAGSACNTSGAATNGACVTQEAAGFGFPFTDNMDILQNFGAKTFPSGIANHIFQCAASQKCTICK
jgi:hypothetical protein